MRLQEFSVTCGIVFLALSSTLAGDEQVADDMEVVRRIRAEMVPVQSSIQEPLKSYTGTIPSTGVKFEMVAIPEGTFLQGSPAKESSRREDEGPQREVLIGPFWMGKYEVTWDEYEPFMLANEIRRRDGSPVLRTESSPLEDIVSSPSLPYMVDYGFGMGVKGYPAINMTQHAALKYCQWLSAQTGHFYRLPTEAEWEYACRAGTTTAYSWGDKSELAEEYAWYWENSEDGYHKVGLKKPNPWGLHDIHGNVMEWTLDRYLSDAYAMDLLPWVKRGESQYPRVVRGGSWYDDREDLRSAARVSSSDEWKSYDPQSPRSVWYMTEMPNLGFRIVRTPDIPSAEEMHTIWSQGMGTELGLDPFDR